MIQRDSKFIPMHPEMFDEHGNIIPDEIYALRFDNPEDFNSSEGPLNE